MFFNFFINREAVTADPRSGPPSGPPRKGIARRALPASRVEDTHVFVGRVVG